MKNENVCKGCRYYIKQGEYRNLDNTCNYAIETGRSRLKIEEASGGYREDSCVCYDSGKRKKGGVIPWSFKGGNEGEGKRIPEAD